MAEWLKAADCKSVLIRVRWFESIPAHQKVEILTDFGFFYFYSKLFVSIDITTFYSFPYFNNTREFILERLEGYIERQNCLNAYDNEKFYRNGFCDGVQLMLEILKNDN